MFRGNQGSGPDPDPEPQLVRLVSFTVTDVPWSVVVFLLSLVYFWKSAKPGLFLPWKLHQTALCSLWGRRITTRRGSSYTRGNHKCPSFCLGCWRCRFNFHAQCGTYSERYVIITANVLHQILMEQFTCCWNDQLGGGVVVNTHHYTLIIRLPLPLQINPKLEYIHLHAAAPCRIWCESLWDAQRPRI